MKIAIIGTGYVGLPSGVGFAHLGHDVVCIDKDATKINNLKQSISPIFEDGLSELLQSTVKSGKIKFTTDMQEGISSADIVIIAVGTPPHPVTKEADLSYIYAVAKEMAPFLSGYTTVATKSTVPVGTGDKIEQILKDVNPTADFDVISLPEFLREGFAVYDFFNPDRIIVGTNSERSKEQMKQLYAPFGDKANIVFVNRKSSETIKYASNAFLAIKIHYINEIANFCEKSGADVFEVAKGIGLDNRIGNKFLNPGPGYGGSCFPKDTNAMAYMAKQYGMELQLIQTAITGNDNRRIDMANKILHSVKDIPNAKIAVLGLAFKGGTDDCRMSPAIDIVKILLEKNANITAFDPKAMDNAKQILSDRIKYASSAYEAVENADVLVVLTEWEEFKSLDLNIIKNKMKTPNIVDLRNLLNKQQATELGFSYKGIGR